MKNYFLLIMSTSMVFLSIYLVLDFKAQLLKCDVGVGNVIKNIEIDMSVSKDKSSIQDLYQQGDARKYFLKSRAKEWLKAIYILYAIIIENLIIFCFVMYQIFRNIFPKFRVGASEQRVPCNKKV